MKIRSLPTGAAAALLLVACGDGGELGSVGPTVPLAPATLSVTISTMGRAMDRDGYTVRLGTDSVAHVGVGGTFAVTGLPKGSRPLTLDGLRHNCTVTGGNGQTVELRSGATTDVSFAVTCAPTDIAFVARVNGSGPYGLYVRRGADEPQLLASPVNPSRVTWSPDGHKIAYTIGDLFVGGTQVWYIDVDSMKRVPIVTPGTAMHPDWSPDGQRLVYRGGVVSGVSTSPDLWTVRLDGSEPARLTSDAAGTEQMPTWSPDGARIAYVFWNSSNVGLEIRTIKADATDTRLVTSTCCTGYSTLAWSRDGARIFFSSVTAEDRARDQIYSIRTDGNDLVQLTRETALSWLPATLADGRVGFLRIGDIWTMNADGSDVRNISNTPGLSEIAAAWQ